MCNSVWSRGVAALALLAAPAIVSAQSAQFATPALRGSVERIKVHGKGLEGNLEGDSPDRDVSIYLPPSYKTEANRRYPVLYMLHGFTDDDARWYGFVKHWINFPQVIEKALAGGQVRDMIIVMPNAYTRFKGSFYSNSITTGDWEDFVASELVAYIDSHYRTIPSPASRGLAGHSMGGYGTMRIAMKHPDVFSSAYLLSPCCLAPNQPGPQSPQSMAKIEGVRTVDEVAKADFLTSAILSTAAAWAPDPKNPPLFLDLPFKDGKPDAAIEAKFAANSPLAMIDQYITNLKKLRAFAFDAGDKDQPIASTIQNLDRILEMYGVPHRFEIYEGNHISGVAQRLETKALPFFSKNLRLEDGGREPTR